MRAGQLLAAALLSIRHSRDTSVIERATWLGHYLHDGRVFASAVEVATDSSASEWARVAAIRALLWTKAPSQYRLSLSEMLLPPECGENCASTYRSHYYCGCGYTDGAWPWPAFGEVLLAGYADRIDAVAGSLAVGPQVPVRVRAAARHVLAVRAEGDYLKGR